MKQFVAVADQSALQTACAADNRAGEPPASSVSASQSRAFRRLGEIRYDGSPVAKVCKVPIGEVERVLRQA